MSEHMTRAERETWLIAFANRDLDEEVVPVCDQKELIRRIWDFGHHKRSSVLPTGGTITRESVGGVSKCTWKEVLEANNRASLAVFGLLQNKETPKWEIRTLELSVYGMVTETGDGASSHGELYQVTRTVLDAFTFEMCLILARLADKISRCPALKAIPLSVASKPAEHPHQYCNKFFLRSRKDKRFCSDTCRVREAMRQNRKRQRDT